MSVTYLATQPNGRIPNNKSQLGFAVVISGYNMSTHPGIMSMLDGAGVHSMPVLLYTTDQDQTILPSMTHALASRFDTVQYYKDAVTDGHSIPRPNTEGNNAIRNFIIDRYTSAPTNTYTSQAPMKILCLHGGNDNGAALQMS